MSDYIAKKVNKLTADRVVADKVEAGTSISKSTVADSARFSDIRIVALRKSRPLDDVKSVVLKSAEDWEHKGIQSYKSEARPVGRFLGDYENLAAAWAANYQGTESTAGDVYWDTTKKSQYELKGTNSRVENFRYGSDEVPAECVIVVHGSGVNCRVTIFDLTRNGSPVWMVFVAGSATHIASVSGVGLEIFKVDYAEGRIVLASGGSASRGLIELDLRNDKSHARFATGYFMCSLPISGRNQENERINYSVLPQHVLSGSSVADVFSFEGKALAATDSGVRVLQEDRTVLKSQSSSPFAKVVELNGRMYALNIGTSTVRVFDFGEIGKLTDNFTTKNIYSANTVPALSSPDLSSLHSVDGMLAVGSPDALDFLYIDPDGLEPPTFSRKGLTFATPWMKKPEAMLICSIDEGPVADSSTIVDYSGKGNDGVVHGTLVAAAEVAGGVAGLSGFSVANYLETPYNAALDVGTGDFLFTAAFKVSSSGVTQSIFIRADLVDIGNKLSVTLNPAGELRVILNGANSADSSSGYADNLLHTVLAYRRDGTLFLSVDNSVIDQVVDSSDITNTSAVTRVGQHTDNGKNFRGSLWFVGASAVAPTDEEVSLIHSHMRNLITGKANLDEIPSSLAYNALSGTVEAVGDSYHQTLVDGSVTKSVTHGQGTAPDVTCGGRGEVVVGGSAGLLVSVPERNLREAEPVTPSGGGNAAPVVDRILTSEDNVILGSRSEEIQRIMSTRNGIKVRLPDASSCEISSKMFTIINDGEFCITIEDGAGKDQGFLPAGSQCTAALLSNETVSGEWKLDGTSLFAVDMVFKGVELSSIHYIVPLECAVIGEGKYLFSYYAHGDTVLRGNCIDTITGSKSITYGLGDLSINSKTVATVRTSEDVITMVRGTFYGGNQITFRTYTVLEDGLQYGSEVSISNSSGIAEPLEIISCGDSWVLKANTGKDSFLIPFSVSGTTVTVGTPFSLGIFGLLRATYLGNGKLLAVYQYTTSYIGAVLCTISGNSIVGGAVKTISSSTTGFALHKLSAERAAIVYRGGYLKGAVISLTGTTPSFSEVTLSSFSSNYLDVFTYKVGDDVLVAASSSATLQSIFTRLSSSGGTAIAGFEKIWTTPGTRPFRLLGVDEEGMYVAIKEGGEDYTVQKFIAGDQPYAVELKDIGIISGNGRNMVPNSSRFVEAGREGFTLSGERVKSLILGREAWSPAIIADKISTVPCVEGVADGTFTVGELDNGWRIKTIGPYYELDRVRVL